MQMLHSDVSHVNETWSLQIWKERCPPLTSGALASFIKWLVLVLVHESPHQIMKFVSKLEIPAHWADLSKKNF